MWDKIIFLVIAAQHQSRQYTCCSECMREKIPKKTFNRNILTAWVLWVILMFPWHMIAYVLTYLPGHSKSVKKDVGL